MVSQCTFSMKGKEVEADNILEIAPDEPLQNLSVKQECQNLEQGENDAVVSKLSLEDVENCIRHMKERETFAFGGEYFKMLNKRKPRGLNDGLRAHAGGADVPFHNSEVRTLRCSEVEVFDCTCEVLVR